jgi:hypothetical protein
VRKALGPGMPPLVALVATVALAGCARTIAPEGGAVPETPPAVVRTVPDTFAVVEGFNGPVRIEFERTLGERLTTGALRDAVVVSPRTGDVEIKQGRTHLEINMEGGFPAGALYRITVLPRFQDRYRNTMDRPVDLFFSTGPDFDPTLVAGLVTDRLTGQIARGARVDAVPEEEGPTYSAVSDSTGVFGFRYLPPGGYELVAYDDRNRNLEPDFAEPQARASLAVASADTLVVTELPLLAPDTTAARLLSAEALDSVAVALDFDDYFDPERAPTGVQARLLPLEEQDPEAPVNPATLPQVVEILHQHAWETRQAEGIPMEPPAAPADTLDPADPDTIPPPAAEPEEPEEEAEEEAVEEILLPSQRLVAVLSGPLPPGVRVRIVVEGAVNLHGLTGGGGEAAFDTPEPPPPAAEPEPDPGPPPTIPPAPERR